MFTLKNIVIIFFFSFLVSSVCYAQFPDSFDTGKNEGWALLTGDGTPGLEFIQKNGWGIKVESQIGKGSKFIFTLPSQN